MQIALFSLAYLAALATAASPPEILWRGGKTDFELAHSMSLRSGHGKFIANQCLSNQAAIQKPALSMHDVYDVYGVLGSGLLAKVRQGIHRISKKTYAIKTIDLSKLRADQRESLRRETNNMKAVDQPDTIQIHEIFEEEDKLHLVLEFSEGADILEYTLALELFEYIVMKTSVLYSPHRTAPRGHRYPRG